MKRKVLKPNVIGGGQAIPMGDNFYYMRGRSHAQGGIDIGDNPKTGLEVEDGEVMHLTNKDIKVYSSVPFLNGKSPAQKVIGGENPTKVFNEQERYKKRKGINDDGSKKKEIGGKNTVKYNTTGGTGYIPNQINTNKIINDISNLYKYSKNYIKSKILGEGDGEFINLSNKNVSRIKNNTKNVSSILTNEFVEHNKNTIRRKKDFINTNDTLLGDKKIPLSKISTYYGIENGKLKAGSINTFNDTTTIIPNRSKNIGKIKKVLFASKKDVENERKNIDNIITNYNKQHGYKPNNFYKFINTIFPWTEINQYRILTENEGRGAVTRVVNNNIKKGKLKLISDKAITENNDTINIDRTWLNATPKIMFANEKGNSVFISNIRNPNNIKQLNEFLDKNPSYPIMVDNGRYATHMTNYPNVRVYSGFNNADNMFILGTINNKNKKAMGGKTDNELSLTRRQYRTGGLYSLTVDGETKMRQFPTGKRTKARIGTRKKVDPLVLSKDSKNNRSIIQHILNTANLENKENKIDFSAKPSAALTSYRSNLLKVDAPTPLPPGYKAPKDSWIKRTMNKLGVEPNDVASLIPNIAGSIITHSINNRMLNTFKEPQAPIARQAVKLKTRINIEPQLDKMRESLAEYERQVDNNTASSNVALARKNNFRLANIMNTNALYADKENKETALINQDRLNRQTVADANIREYNEYLARRNQYQNTIAEKRAENSVGLINNINAGIQNMLSNIDRRKAENRNIAAMAFAHPDLPIELFDKAGIVSKEVGDWYRTGIGRNRRGMKNTI